MTEDKDLARIPKIIIDPTLKEGEWKLQLDKDLILAKLITDACVCDPAFKVRGINDLDCAYHNFAGDIARLLGEERRRLLNDPRFVFAKTELGYWSDEDPALKKAVKGLESLLKENE